MNPTQPQSDFLVLSRGKWNPAAPKAEVQAAIDQFYQWYQAHLKSGLFKPGSRLTTAAAIVTQNGVVTDGPFCEAAEVIGGYWFVVAPDLAAAAAIMSQNPCLRFGIYFEIRPLESERASAYHHTNETPSAQTTTH